MYRGSMIRSFFLVFACCLLCFGAGAGVIEDTPESREIPLEVKAGVPLRVTLEEKTPIREGQFVRATLVHPLYVFDRELVPAGAKVLGRVKEVQRVSGKQRAKTYMQGKFRIKKDALVEFDTLILADGREVPLNTSVTLGAPAVIRLTAGAKEAQADESKGGVVKSAKQKIKGAVKNNEIVQALRSNDSGGEKAEKITKKARAKKAARSKWNGVKNALLAYWPFGAQNLRAGTTFTAVVEEPLDFGTARLDVAKLDHLGRPPAPDSVVEARLLETISSETAEVGDPVQAEITRPLFSPEGKLILPEGALLEGEVTQVKPARRFGRDGKLRFRFTKIEMPSGLSQLVNGSLAAVEVDSRSRMRLDDEGGAKVKASKKRFIAPAVSVALSMTAVPDGDDGEPPTTTVQGSAPGWSGFGIIGSAVALSAPAAAGPLGIWGAANSVFFNLVRKADELEFPKNTLLEIRLGRTPEETESPPAQLKGQPQAQEKQTREPRVLRKR